MRWSRPSSWWRFETEAEAPRVERHWWTNDRRSARWQGARSTAWRIVLRPERRYQALRLRRTAARLGGLTAALQPSYWHPCRSTAQWIAWDWLGRAGDLPGIDGGGRSQFGHDLNLHLAVLQLPFIVLLEQYRRVRSCATPTAWSRKAGPTRCGPCIPMSGPTRSGNISGRHSPATPDCASIT